MDSREQFQTWLREICRWNREDWFVEWEGEAGAPNMWSGRAQVYTKTNRYTIRAKVESDHTYLACGVSQRKPRAGETWTRGNDLPDGAFAQETWDRIKNAIIQYELVKIVKPIRKPQTEEVEESTEIK